jgi:hypothetical protein
MVGPTQENGIQLACGTLPADRLTTIAPERLKELHHEYAERVAVRRHTYEVGAKILNGMQYTITGAAIAVGGSGPLFFVGAAAFALFVAMNAIGAGEDANAAGEDAYASHCAAMKNEFLLLQRQAIGAGQKELLRLADEHLSRCELLDTKTLSYLAAMPPDLLGGASDQLAISVLQARQMLAHVRQQNSGEAGVEACKRLPTFSQLGFDRRRGDHRTLLRTMLEKNAPSLAEDAGPPLVELEVPAPPKLNIGLAGWLGRAFAGGFIVGRDRRKQQAFALPDIPAMKVPVLRPIEGFADILVAFEKSHGRLDLPALRGWGGKHKLLAPPHRAFLPAYAPPPAPGL